MGTHTYPSPHPYFGEVIAARDLDRCHIPYVCPPLFPLPLLQSAVSYGLLYEAVAGRDLQRCVGLMDELCDGAWAEAEAAAEAGDPAAVEAVVVVDGTELHPRVEAFLRSCR